MDDRMNATLAALVKALLAFFAATLVFKLAGRELVDLVCGLAFGSETWALIGPGGLSSLVLMASWILSAVFAPGMWFMGKINMIWSDDYPRR